MKYVARMMVIAFVLICLSGYALAAQSPKLDGQPTMFNPGKSTGYFMWQDNEGLHLRTTSETKHVFSGVIRTNGRFENVFGKMTETDDYARVNRNRNEISFTFTTAGGEAGVDLALNGGTYIKFDLAMDGEGADPVSIFIGRDGWHPGDYKFTLRNDGDKNSDNNDRTIIIVDGGFWWGWTFPHHPYRHPGPGPKPAEPGRGWL